MSLLQTKPLTLTVMTPKTPDGKNSGDGSERRDVDIDDPEFWTKMVGEAKADEATIDTGKKRKRNPANYSESLYSREIDHQIKFIDSEGSDSDSDEVREDDFDEGDVSDSSGSPRKKRKREFAKWGRKDCQGWKRVDVEKLVKALHTHGYGNMPWEEFCRKGDLSEYDCLEVSFVLVLFEPERRSLTKIFNRSNE